MSSLSSMIKKLEPLGVYNLSGQSVVYAELAAFAVGLDMLRSTLDTLLRESFVATAQDYGITYIERLVGSERSDLSIEQRRLMLMERLSFSTGDFTPEGFGRMLRLLGVEGDIEEHPLSQRISLNLSQKDIPTAQREWILSQAEALLPAHLEWEVVFAGFTWADADAAALTFAEIEGKGLSWNTVDYMI